MGIKEKILKSMGFFLANLREKTLQTLEEVEANTNNGYWAGAGAVSELNNKLAGQPEWVMDSAGKIIGYKVPGGADTVLPFNSNYQINATFVGSKYGDSGYRRVIRHTFAIKVINGDVSCSDLGKLFTNAVAEAGNNHEQDIYLQSLTVTKI